MGGVSLPWAFSLCDFMNPMIKIGRYEIPIGSVIGVQTRQVGRLQRFYCKLFRRVPTLQYDVYLAGGITLCLTEEEKQQLDEERATHEAVMQVMGMIAGLQANQRPGR